MGFSGAVATAVTMPNSETQILMVSHAFPPDIQVGGMRTARFCRYLPDFAIRPIVLTAQERFYPNRDNSFSVPPGTRVERTTMIPTPLDLYGALRTRWVSAPLSTGTVDRRGESRNRSEIPPNGKSSRGFRRHTRALLSIPDTFWGWYLPAVRAAEKLIARESFSALFSSGPPWTSHLIACHLTKKFRIPWIADFRDAWSRETWRPELLPRWRDSIDERLEATCLRSASLVVSVTDFIRNGFLRHYPNLPAAKFVTLTNGYDDSESSSSLSSLNEGTAESRLETDLSFFLQNRSTRLLLHLGNLYIGRRIGAFCEAVARLISTGKMDTNSISVAFVGDASPDIVAEALQRVPDLIREGRIVFHRRIGWQNAQEVLERADVLLIFQGDHPGVTAKFYEYLRTGKPILAIVREGALRDIMDATRAGFCADPEDAGDIASKLLQAMAQPVRKTKDINLLAGQYHIRSLTERLAGWIHDLTATPTAGVPE